MRYTEIGFTEDAHLDDGDLWPTVFAVARMTDPVSDRVRELVARVG